MEMIKIPIMISYMAIYSEGYYLTKDYVSRKEFRETILKNFSPKTFYLPGYNEFILVFPPKL
ncbi:hypothetical protein BK008_07860 [Methanobacterium sp. MZ-A1]|jgi:hypothetical protein|uniref:Uncharacterized protein n=1 Tax=Methanobacterium subterraneum TaxID=59277 RepID=A0A2H4VM98_9EURY|nr:hypothetical protein BK008_07860 [Methanobacterium sp. MZ-A1]AUB59218.1 hypothetical protein BK009_00065 [Methanobacterium subterraneum]